MFPLSISRKVEGHTPEPVRRRYDEEEGNMIAFFTGKGGEITLSTDELYLKALETLDRIDKKALRFGISRLGMGITRIFRLGIERR